MKFFFRIAGQAQGKALYVEVENEKSTTAYGYPRIDNTLTSCTAVRVSGLSGNNVRVKFVGDIIH